VASAFENHIQWQAVKEVCDRLKKAGYVALLAGGCVRDFLMKRQPNDFDIATDATPDQVEALFPRSLSVGKAFGVIVVPFDGFQIEVATFREDLEYKDGRRPEGIVFSSPEADAQRRDFTINALFYDIEHRQVIDYVQGEIDIWRRVIRTVGEPAHRFNEDKLRLLRAVRFAAQLEFEIAPETFAAIQLLAPQANVVSRERIRDEFVKLFKSTHFMTGLRLLITSGLLASLFPELSARVSSDEAAWLRRFEVMEMWDDVRDVDHDLTVALALFFMPLADVFDEREIREKHLKNLKLDKRQIEAVLFALRARAILLDPRSTREGEVMLLLMNADAASAQALASVLERVSGSEGVSVTENESYLNHLSKRATGEDGRQKVEAFLTGDDAQTAGIAPGPEMGQLLREALLLQLEGQFADREAALAWLRNQVLRRD
jgi:poly(A) polymerase